jgi:hypothetical protein
MPASLKRIGPVALTTTLTTNIYNNTSALIYDVVRMIHVVNKTDLASTFSLWVGATGANAAGTELFSRQSVSPRSSFEWPFPVKLLSTDFLVGGADLTNSSLTLILVVEQAVV